MLPDVPVIVAAAGTTAEPLPWAATVAVDEPPMPSEPQLNGEVVPALGATAAPA